MCDYTDICNTANNLGVFHRVSRADLDEAVNSMRPNTQSKKVFKLIIDISNEKYRREKYLSTLMECFNCKSKGHYYHRNDTEFSCLECITPDFKQDIIIKYVYRGQLSPKMFLL